MVCVCVCGGVCVCVCDGGGGGGYWLCTRDMSCDCRLLKLKFS